MDQQYTHHPIILSASYHSIAYNIQQHDGQRNKQTNFPSFRLQTIILLLLICHLHSIIESAYIVVCIVIHVLPSIWHAQIAHQRLACW